MANTYTQLQIHAVFAPRFRDAVIHPSWEEDLYRYLTGAVQGQGHKMLQVNGMPDHVHCLIGMHPKQSVMDLLKTTKEESSRWINKNDLVRGRFAWQPGYGAFSVDKRGVPAVATYIQLQKVHHQKMDFRSEYRKLLKKAEVEYDERYIFRDLE